MLVRDTIDRFHGEFAFLSNFAPANVKYGPYAFGSVEQAYQFAKLSKDKIIPAVVEKFQSSTPAKTKAFGRLLREKGMIRPDWDEIKDQVMQYLLEEKFAIPELRERLLLTGLLTLVEGNVHHDNEWGDCRCTTVLPAERRFGQKQGCHIRGRNKLGQMLMAIRTSAFAADPFRCPRCGSSTNLSRLDMVPVRTLGHFTNRVFELGKGPAFLDWDRQGPEHTPSRYWCDSCQLEFALPEQQ